MHNHHAQGRDRRFHRPISRSDLRLFPTISPPGRDGDAAPVPHPRLSMSAAEALRSVADQFGGDFIHRCPGLVPGLAEFHERPAGFTVGLHILDAFSAQGLARAATDYVIADPATMKPIVGRVVERGLSDELHDRHYLIMDATDGRSHYVDIGSGEATDVIPAGALVRIEPKIVVARGVDRTVAEIAAAHVRPASA